MWWNKKRKLQHLFDELRGIALVDRMYADRTDLTLDDRYAHAQRLIRQAELLAEIERLTPKKRPHISLDAQRPALARSEKISAVATREQDPVRLLQRPEKLKRALDERGRVRRRQEPAAAA